MSFFKTLKNRLFGESTDPNENLTIDQNEDEQYEKENLTDPIVKPTFRFPIVTDSEIYGWEEPADERQYREPTSSTNKVDEDDYETIPLYENERWPGNDTPGKIFRAGSAPKYKANPERERNRSSTGLNGDTEKYVPPITVPKKVNKRFTPSTVPSPIHGFSTRKKQDTRAFVEEEIQAMLNAEQEPTLEKPSILTELIAVEKEAKAVEQVIHSEKIEEQVMESNIPIVQTNKKEQENATQNFEDTQLINKENVDPEVKQESLFSSIDSKQEEVEVAQVEEELISLDSEFAQVAKIEDVEEINTTQQYFPENKKEKVMPFNVLMLKSDKEKLANAKQQLHRVPEVKKSAETVEHTIQEQTTAPIAADVYVEEESHYVLPSTNLLIPPETHIEDTEWLVSQSEKLEESLSHFGVQASVIEAVQGPTVTRFELTVGQGTKVSRVRNLTDDLKLTLAAKEIRIQAPIPGKSSIGIEIPNRKTRPVRISEVIATDGFAESTSPLEAVLGLSLTGTPVTLDLRKMPHGMIAGATGSGKSVCINSILVSLLYKASPTELKMMLIDPKMVELAPFNGIPHLISPVITDVKAATAALKWAVAEMERRYELLAHAGVRDIERYNKVAEESRRFSLKMPYLLIVIDELADLMMMAPADVEVSISRIAQKARACGIHLIIATQRPSVDVITGTIKANIPTRIAFSVSSQIDSRTIIDTGGAERLLGKGDMLYLGNGQSDSVRLQGTFVTDDEIERIIEHVQQEASPTYLFGQDELLRSAVEEEESDPLFEEACMFIYNHDSASTSLLQRNFSIGYNRAAKLIDRMEKHGFISEQRGSKARDVFLTESDIEKLSEPIL